MADSVFKVLIVGEVNVGKTSLQIYEGNPLQERYIPTIGVDFSIRTQCVDDQIIRLQLKTNNGQSLAPGVQEHSCTLPWDTSGSEKYRVILNSYCRGAHGFIIVYDVTNRESFDKVAYWLTYVQKYCSTDARFFLVGNKADLSDIKVTLNEGELFAEEHQMEYFVTSAKHGESVTTMFKAVAKDLLYHLESEELHRRQPCAARHRASRSAACALL